MLLFAAIFQILGLGDVVQGSVTATGAIMTRTSNKLLYTTGYMIAGAGIVGSALPMPQIIESMNDVSNSYISDITSQIQLYDGATVDSVVQAFRQSIKQSIGDFTGPIFQWISGAKPEIAGLIGPGPGTTDNIGFRLTDEMIKRLDRSNNLYYQIMQRVTLKTPPHLEVAVWEPARNLFAEAIAKALNSDPSLGLGSMFNNALDYIWSSTPSIDPELLLIGTDVLVALIEATPAGPIAGEIAKATGGKIGAAKVRMLMENAKTYLKYKN